MKKTASILFSAMLILSVGRIMAQYPAGSGFGVAERPAESRINKTIPLLGTEAPSFTAQSTTGEINFPADFGSDWKILFSHPKDFTPVCSSELLELAHEQESFDQLDARLIVVSTDMLDQHKTWKAILEEIHFQGREPVEINFPMVDDNSLKVSNLYGMIHSAVSVGENIRGVFIIDPENKVRAINFYPNEVGRNIDELKRTLIALQKTYNNKNIVMPANWQPGDDVLVPVISAEERQRIGEPGSPLYQLSWFMTYMKIQE